MKESRIQAQKRIAAELRGLLHEWNPIGVALPPDEYDCVIKPLLGKLQKGCTEEFIEKFLREWVEDHLGLSRVAGLGAFAGKIVAWYPKSGG